MLNYGCKNIALENGLHTTLVTSVLNYRGMPGSSMSGGNYYYKMTSRSLWLPLALMTKKRDSIIVAYFY